jgi:hypothetical protein
MSICPPFLDTLNVIYFLVDLFTRVIFTSSNTWAGRSNSLISD